MCPHLSTRSRQGTPTWPECWRVHGFSVPIPSSAHSDLQDSEVLQAEENIPEEVGMTFPFLTPVIISLRPLDTREASLRPCLGGTEASITQPAVAEEAGPAASLTFKLKPVPSTPTAVSTPPDPPREGTATLWCLQGASDLWTPEGS